MRACAGSTRSQYYQCKSVTINRNYFNITTDYLLKDEIETIDGADNYSSKNVDMQMLNKELSENDFQNIRYEAEKKKHTSYWLLIIAPFIMILIIFIFYYGFYR